MTDADKLKLCSGCRDDFYNDHNPYGVKRCWSLDSAQPVVKTMVGVWQNPPYTWRPQTTLSCHRPDGSVWINSDDVRIREPEPEPTAFRVDRATRLQRIFDGDDR